LTAVALERDAQALASALKNSGEQVHVELSPEAAEVAQRAVEAQAKGRVIIVADAEGNVTPAQAGLMLGLSRVQVRRIMDRGEIPYRMVGSHHRMKAADVQGIRRKVQGTAAASTSQNG
jgi:excisionase family DNA binding protein